jgi:BirA family biotin operon repressor/biotin-[acetyl-CoA-carboxylase] ligase
MKHSQFIPETFSTNALLWEMLRKELLPEGFVVHTDFQMAGKGQIGNSWESERGENLLFSMVLYPQRIPMDQLFLISQLVSVAIKNALDIITEGITVKWPNDIYWNDRKLAGILIENSFQANKVKTVIGIGLNVNQNTFVSSAPNPVSLRQIIGKTVDITNLLESICRNIIDLYTELNVEYIYARYAQMLFRKDGFHRYKSENGLFTARIIAVQPDGQLELETEAGERKSFYFKEVQFLM